MRMYDVVALGELLIDFVHQGNNDVGYPLMQGNPGGAPGNFFKHPIQIRRAKPVLSERWEATGLENAGQNLSGCRSRDQGNFGG